VVWKKRTTKESFHFSRHIGIVQTALPLSSILLISIFCICGVNQDISAGFEPPFFWRGFWPIESLLWVYTAYLRVWGERDNHYTTETDESDVPPVNPESGVRLPVGTRVFFHFRQLSTNLEKHISAIKLTFKWCKRHPMFQDLQWGWHW